MRSQRPRVHFSDFSIHKQYQRVQRIQTKIKTWILFCLGLSQEGLLGTNQRKRKCTGINKLRFPNYMNSVLAKISWKFSNWNLFCSRDPKDALEPLSMNQKRNWVSRENWAFPCNFRTRMTMDEYFNGNGGFPRYYLLRRQYESARPEITFGKLQI